MSDWKSSHPRMCSALLLGFIVFSPSNCEVSDEKFSAACWLTAAHTRDADWLITDGSTASSRMSRVVLSMIASKSCLLCFMMFLQIIADLFSQACSCAVQRDRDYHL